MSGTVWLRDCWQVAAYGSEVGDRLLARRLLDEPVILYRTSDGTVHALADRCAHRALPLSKGRLVGDVVQCGYHGLRYGTDGVCVGVPGQDSVPPNAVVKTYPTVERYSFVWMWMGNPALADPSLVPDFHWFNDPAWAVARGYHHVDADYRLLNDNLLDLSHESFVHLETIGAAAVADSPVTAKIVDDTVRVQRFMYDFPSPPFYKRATGFTQNIDRWHTTIYRPPGFHVIENGSMPAGADRCVAKERRVLNLITPESPTTSHYFWGIARQYDRDDAELTEMIRSETDATFDQDAEILAAQQTALGPNPVDAFPVHIKIDAGPILGRRLLEEKIRQSVSARDAATI